MLASTVDAKRAELAEACYSCILAGRWSRSSPWCLGAGYDIILNTTGRDATEDFEEIGHSNAAREMLEKFVIGKFEVCPNSAAWDCGPALESTVLHDFTDCLISASYSKAMLCVSRMRA